MAVAVSAAAAGTMGAAGTAAGTGGVGEGREHRASKPDSRRSFWARAGARAEARAGTAEGARLGDIKPGRSNREIGRKQMIILHRIYYLISTFLAHRNSIYRSVFL